MGLVGVGEVSALAARVKLVHAFKNPVDVDVAPHDIPVPAPNESPTEWAALRALWQSATPPAWTPERAERVFSRVMATLEQRRRRSHRIRVAAGLLASAAVAVVAARFLR